MTIRLNAKGAANARALIAAGKVDKAASWKHSAHEGAEWYLGINFVQPPAAQSHYAYPFGKDGKVYRHALVVAKDRALRNGDADIDAEVTALLALVDKPSAPVKPPIVAPVPAAAVAAPAQAPAPPPARQPAVASPQNAPDKKPAPPPWAVTLDRPKDAP